MAFGSATASKDAQSASYSADDLALVQRDIGQLVQYTSEMGGSMELLELALRIPPWEPMHRLTGPEVRSMRIDTDANATSRQSCRKIKASYVAMSALGQKQTRAAHKPMSAKCQ